MKKILFVAACCTAVVSTQAHFVTSYNTHMVYTQDTTPEYKKSPAAYLTAFAQGDRSLDCDALRYALAEAGAHLSPNNLLRIKTRLTHTINATQEELTQFEQQQSSWHLPRVTAGFIELGLSAGALKITCMLTKYLNKLSSIPWSTMGYEDYYTLENKQNLAATGIIITAATGIILLPCGLYDIYRAQASVHIKELKSQIIGCAYLLETVTELLEQA